MVVLLTRCLPQLEQQVASENLRVDLRHRLTQLKDASMFYQCTSDSSFILLTDKKYKQREYLINFVLSPSHHLCEASFFFAVLLLPFSLTPQPFRFSISVIISSTLVTRASSVNCPVSDNILVAQYRSDTGRSA